MRAIARGASVTVVLVAVAAADGQVFLRGQAEPVAGDVTKVAPEGVTVTVSTPTAEPPLPKSVVSVYSWDKVREVRGERGAEAGVYLSVGGMADSLWRARSRMERGDEQGARGLIEKLFEKSRGLSGPTGVVLCDGVMRSRLAEGRSGGALWAFFDHSMIVMGAGRKERETWHGLEVRLPAVVDAGRGLAPRLAPAFSIAAQGPAVRGVAESPEWKRWENADDFTKELAATYRAAARWEMMATAASEDGKSPLKIDDGVKLELAPSKSGDDAINFVADIVRARAGTAEERGAARSRLRKRIEGLSAGGGAEGESVGLDAAPSVRFVEAWCRLGVGRSLLREGAEAERRLGVVELLHLPARFADITPELAAMALRECADALAALGDAAGAKRLNEELKMFVGELPDAAPSEEDQSEGDESAG